MRISQAAISPLKTTALLLSLTAVTGCHGAKGPELGAESPSIQLTTTAFHDGDRIPGAFTCDGANTSPALAWSDPPAATKTFALVMDDPDAPMGTFVHWVIYNLPPTARSLPAAEPTQAKLSDGSLQGKNNFPGTGYGGPCPPGHSEHHYRFIVYAVDSVLPLQSGATKGQVEDALKGHIVARGKLTGRYSRP
jgi:Raf kinase inhibitor-like YbhB/YbcL family protein